MDFRSASIAIDKSMLTQAVSAHLGEVLRTINTDEHFDTNIIETNVEVDGETKRFCVMYVLTDVDGISGVILEMSAPNEEDETLNQLTQVFVRFIGGEIAPIQQVATMMEVDTVRNRAATTKKGIDLLLG